MIYLASPYSHQSEAVMETRYKIVLRLTAQLIFTQGEPVFSPIVYGHHMSREFDLGTDAEFWSMFNTAAQRACSSLYVACIAGWEQSKGVSAEIEFAKVLRQPITYIDTFGGKYENHRHEPT